MKKRLSLIVLFLFALLLVGCTETTHTVTFNNEGNTSTVEVVDGNLLDRPTDPTKDGYTFKGWFKDEAFKEPWNWTEDKVKSNLTLYAKWEADGTPSVDKFNVTFNLNYEGATAPSVVQVESGQKATAPTAPTRSGFTFDGWSTSKTEKVAFDFNTAITKDTTLYAVWKVVAAGETVSVTFEFNYSGSAAPVVKEVDKGTKVTAPELPTRSDFEFVGWSTSRTEYVKFDLDVVVNADVRVYAHWRSTKVEHTVTVDFGHSDLTESKLVLSGETLEIDDPIRDGFCFLGWLKDGVDFDLDTPITKDITITAEWLDMTGLEGTVIRNAQELVELFETGGSGSYILGKDIDMADVPYEGSLGSGDSAVRFSGTFDGNNKRIKNLNVVTPGNKSAAMFGILNGATIKNLIIMRSSINVPGEAAGFVSAYAYGGTTFENLTFINVSTNSTGSYAGLLYADNSGTAGEDPVVIKNIVVVNDTDHEIKAGRYAAALVGYLRNAQTLNISNVYVKSTIKVDKASTASALVSRINNADAVVNVDGAYFEGEAFATNFVGGLIGEANVAAKVDLKNVVLNDVLVHASGSTADLLVGRRHADLTLTTNNIVYADVQVFKNTDTEVPINATEATMKVLDQTWFNASTLDKEFFGYAEGKVTHLVDLGPKVAEKLTVSKNSYNSLFVKGVDTALDLTGLEVSVAYSDGSAALLTADEYNVDLTGFDKNTPGKYIIPVTHENLEGQIEVNVVEILSLTAYTYDVNSLFLVNSVDLTKLVVRANLGDGSSLLLDAEDLVVTYDATVAGVQDVSVKFKDTYTTTFPITIMAVGVTATDGKVTVVVNQALTEASGTEKAGVIHVKTVKEAINLIEKSGLDNNVVKVIEVKDGTYFEKIKISTPNVILRGESQEGTIIDHNHGAGDQKPLGGAWGTQGSASVTISSSAKGFTATNLTISNSFKYYEAEFGDKQGVAMVTEADQALFYKVSFKGLQDTLYAKNGRQWYLDVYVEGIVDYIFGNGGPAFFESSTIHSIARQGTTANVVIAAPKGVGSDGTKLLDYGYVFFNNKLTADAETTVDLGRPWGKDAAVAFVDNKFGSFISEAGWVEMSGNLPENARFVEFNNLIGETPYVSTKGTKLNAEQAALYRDKDVVFATTNGQVTFDGEWDYLASLHKVAPELFATVSFDADGTVTKVIVLKGHKVAEPSPAPVKDKYDFKGWLLGTDEYNFNTLVTGDITLIAKFTAIPEFEVTFMSEGSQHGAVVKVLRGNKVTKPTTNPTKAGHTFDKWLLGTEPYDFETPVTTNLTLTASFTTDPIQKVYVTFMSDGAQYGAKVEVVKGETVGSPETNPTKEGHTFIEWRLDGETEAYNFNAAVNTDITLVAYFEEAYVPEGTAISTAQEFYDMVSTANESGSFYLANDIDFAEFTWPTESNQKFYGILDGNFKTISNLTITTANDRAGLWYSMQGTVKNIIFENAKVSSTKAARSGLISGEVSPSLDPSNPDNVVFENITVDGLTVSGNSTNGVGGLVGYLRQEVTTNNIKILNATLTNETTALGGVFGKIGDSKDTFNINIANVFLQNITLNGVDRVGGLIGESNGASGYVAVNVDNIVMVNMVVNGAGRYAAGLSGRHQSNPSGLGVYNNVYFQGTVGTETSTDVAHVCTSRKPEAVNNFWFKGELVGTQKGTMTTNTLEVASVQDQTWWDTNLAVFSTNDAWEYDETLKVYKLK